MGFTKSILSLSHLRIRRFSVIHFFVELIFSVVFFIDSQTFRNFAPIIEL